MLLNVFVVLVAGHPVDDLRFEQSKAATLEEVCEVCQGALRERTFTFVPDEVVVATFVHTFVRSHSKAEDLNTNGRLDIRKLELSDIILTDIIDFRESKVRLDTS